MIRYFTICSLIGIVIFYQMLISTLVNRYEIFENGIDDINSLPDKVLVYTEENDKVVFSNFDNDVLKLIKKAKDGEEITIPRHGIYTIHVTEKDDKLTIMGIPS